MFDHLAAVPQPLADAETELNSYLSSRLVKYAKLKFDEDLGYSVRTLPEQAGVPADPLQYWKVRRLQFAAENTPTPSVLLGISFSADARKRISPCGKDGSRLLGGSWGDGGFGAAL